MRISVIVICQWLLTVLLIVGSAGGFQHPLSQKVSKWKMSSLDKATRRADMALYYGKQDDNIQEQDDSNSKSDSIPSLITKAPSRSLAFSGIMALCGAALGPFLDSCKCISHHLYRADNILSSPLFVCFSPFCLWSITIRYANHCSTLGNS